MYIIKKDGRTDEFQPSKIETSLNNAAKDVDILLNESDLTMISTDVTNQIKDIRPDHSKTSSYEVIGIILKVLKLNNFNKVAKSYIDFLCTKTI